MRETIKLRNKPELKIILNKDQFEIVDPSDPKNNGIYLSKELKNVQLNEESTKWLFSGLTLIFEFLLGVAAGGGKFKRKAHLNFEMENQVITVWLIDADFEKAKRVAELLNNGSPSM